MRNTIKIALWTKSPPKVAAIEEAIEKCVYFEGKDIEIIPLKVESWISDMPITIEENMVWAKNRAQNCKKEVEADFYIWMEWWTNIFWEKAYLFWVIYILDKNGKWHFGMSNMMEVPEYFRWKIYDEKLELWPILSEVTKEEWASQKWWAFAHWSDDMFTRKDQFILAFLSWIVPFFNKYYKK
jgi:non-canonical (house-cleaning) NTP pyrophosphatase